VSGNAPSPPNEVRACLTSDGVCATQGSGDRPIRLEWSEPHLAIVVAYHIYRFTFDPAAPFPPGTIPDQAIATISVNGGSVPTSFVDDDQLAGPNLAYFVIAEFADGTFSGISNFATITAPVNECLVDQPAPKLAFTGVDFIETPNGVFAQYSLSVTNAANYPDALFAASPQLPACGSIADASRTWVDIYADEFEGPDHRIGGTCTLDSASDLASLSFLVPPEQSAPSRVYITLTDRKCDKVYQSNSVTIGGVDVP
jgi:hypothetical protein